jgi:hypothetical protein
MAEGEADQNGQQRRDGEPHDRPHAQPHRPGPLAEFGDGGGDGEQHQRRDHHPDQVQIEVADRLQPGLGVLPQDQPRDDAEAEADGGADPQGNGEEAGKHRRTAFRGKRSPMCGPRRKTATGSVAKRSGGGFRKNRLPVLFGQCAPFRIPNTFA